VATTLASVAPATADDVDHAIRHHAMRRMMRHEMHREMRHRIIRHIVRREMRHGY
jgi:acyl-CoA reductase-like NAD-dependent aldehyde dehydrogenase